MINARTRSLAAVVDIIRGVTFRPDDLVQPNGQATVACFRTSNIQDDLDLSDVWHLPRSFARRAALLLSEGDILISTANSWNLVGKCAWVPSLPWDSVPGGFIAAVRARRESIIPRYLFHWLRFPHTQASLRNCANKTTNISNLSIERCLMLELSIPRLDEQRRIVAILDQADDLRRRRRLALRKLTEVPQAIFQDMFGNPTANPNSYPVEPLKSLGRVVTGRTPPSAVDGLFGGSIPFVTPGDLDNGGSARRTVTEAGVAAVGTVRRGTALVCCIGATIGKMDMAKERCAFNQQINAVEWSPTIDDTFGFYSLKFLKDRIAISGSSTTLPILKKSRFEQITIPVAPAYEQRLFGKRVAQVSRIQVMQRRHLAELDHLFLSLAQHAFRSGN